MSTKVMGVGIIGYGGIGSLHHKKWLKTLPQFKLCGVWDIKPERLEIAEQEGIHAYKSEADLLADKEIELVIIATPNDVHLPIAINAMNAGKHVVCEKPVAMSLDELKEMIACSRKNKVIFTVDQNRRWDKDFRMVKTAIENGYLGKVYNIESRVYGSRGIPGDWRKYKAHGGGMVLDWGVHLIDQAIIIAGNRKLLSLYTTLDYAHGGECDDGFSVCFKFEDDLTYLCEVRTNNYIQMPRWYVAGKDGTLVIKDWSCDGEIVRKVKEDAEAKPIAASSGMTKTMAPRTEATIEHLPLPDVDVTVADFFLNVRAAIRGEEKQNITAEQLLASTEIMEAMFRSAETNSVITEFEFQK